MAKSRNPGKRKDIKSKVSSKVTQRKDNIPSIKGAPKPRKRVATKNNASFNKTTRDKGQMKHAKDFAASLTDDIPMIGKILPILEDPSKLWKGMSKQDKINYNKIKKDKTISTGDKIKKLTGLGAKYVPGAALNVGLSMAGTPNVTGTGITKTGKYIAESLSPVPINWKKISTTGNLLKTPGGREYLKEQVGAEAKALKDNFLDNSGLSDAMYGKELILAKRQFLKEVKSLDDPLTQKKLKDMGLDPDRVKENIPWLNITAERRGKGSFYNASSGQIYINPRQDNLNYKKRGMTPVSPDAIVAHEWGHSLQRGDNRNWARIIGEKESNRPLSIQEMITGEIAEDPYARIRTRPTNVDKDLMQNFIPDINNSTAKDSYGYLLHTDRYDPGAILEPLSEVKTMMRGQAINSGHFPNFSNNVEAMPMLRETKQSMLRKGYIKNWNDPISKDVSKEYIKKNWKDRVPSFIDPASPNFSHNLDVFTRNINKLPAVLAAPAGIDAINKDKQYADGGTIDPPGTLQQFWDLTGNSKENYDRFGSYLKTLAEAESFSGKKQSSKYSSAKGIYHYLEDSVKTSDQRIKNLIAKHKLPEEFVTILEEEMGKPVAKRSEDMQSIMVLSDMMQSPNAPFNDWTKGKVTDEELYYKGHHTADKSAKSSQDKVYENWRNAQKRLKQSTMKTINKDDRLFFDGPPPPTSGGGGKFLDGFLDLFSNSGSTALDAMGGPLGIANIAAGMITPFISNALGDPTQQANAKGPSSDFDFKAKYSRKDAKRVGGVDDVFNTAGDVLGQIPIVGNIGKLGMEGLKGFGRLFTGGKSSDGDLLNDYMAQFRPELQAQRKSTFANAFAADGGVFNTADLVDPSLKDAGVYEVSAGGTHAQNPHGGVAFAGNSQGGIDRAEEGEVIIDGPNGQKLVFTNRF